MNISLSDGYSFRMEKQPFPEIGPPNHDKGENMTVPISKSITIRDFMNNAISKMGSRYYHYDAFTDNCQKYVVEVLEANGLLTPDIKEFVSQGVEKLLTEIPKLTTSIATATTDLGAIWQGLKGHGLPTDTLSGTEPDSGESYDMRLLRIQKGREGC